jgi:hypothetical protein
MSRIAILSDIHGNLPALEALVADAESRGCTGFANLGDIVSGPLWRRETLDLLMPLGWPTIAGNHDRFLLDASLPGATALDAFAQAQCTAEQHAWLAALPATVELPGTWCTHARPADDIRALIETELPGGADWSPRARKRSWGGWERSGTRCCCTAIRTSSAWWCWRTAGGWRTRATWACRAIWRGRAPAGTEAQYLVLEEGEVIFARVSYDNEAAACRAEANGSPIWARKLREAPPR